MTQEQIDAIKAKVFCDPDMVRAVLSRVPPSWRMIEKMPSGAAFIRGNIQVLFTIQKYELKGTWETWLHVSACGRRGERDFFLPDWEEMKRVKHDFIGPDRWGYQVFPAEKDYVNKHPCVLHIYSRLNGESALPDFTWGLGMI